MIELVKEFLWVEKYRPQTIDECILPVDIKKTFKDMVKIGEAQNLLFSGKAGCGKTTIAKALCNELNADWILINCSESGNIDTLRTTIKDLLVRFLYHPQRKWSYLTSSIIAMLKAFNQHLEVR